MSHPKWQWSDAGRAKAPKNRRGPANTTNIQYDKFWHSISRNPNSLLHLYLVGYERGKRGDSCRTYEEDGTRLLPTQVNLKIKCQISPIKIQEQ